jgi:hypothetical protein
LGLWIVALLVFAAAAVQIKRTRDMWRGNPESYYLRRFAQRPPVPAFWPWPLTTRMWDMFPKWEVVIPICACAIGTAIATVADGAPRTVGIPVIIATGAVILAGLISSVSISYTDRPRVLIPPPLRKHTNGL